MQIRKLKNTHYCREMLKKKRPNGEVLKYLLRNHIPDDTHNEVKYVYGVLCHLQQYFIYFMVGMVVSFIGEWNRRTQRKTLTCRKSLANFIT